MEIVNERAALLSNYEVYKFNRKKKKARKTQAGNTEGLRTLEFELDTYLSATPCGSQTEQQIKQTLTRLLDFPLTKFEKLQIINLRPKYYVELHVLVEECEERFDEDKINEILLLLRENLPRADDPPLEEE